MARQWLFFLGGMLALLVILALTGVVMMSGSYNVAATEKHTELVFTALDRTMQNSISQRAEAVTLPANLDEVDLAAGAERYKSMCQHCHGGPGAEPEDWAKEMYPMPPALSSVADEWQYQEVFWILQHGIKMSGMPAFGPSHADQELWELARFVKELPGMTAADYAAPGQGTSE